MNKCSDCGKVLVIGFPERDNQIAVLKNRCFNLFVISTVVFMIINKLF
jgi:hypothetical protein